jgi:hypothetical protein
MQKNILLIVFLITGAKFSEAQQARGFDFTPYFSAVIVNNIDSSAVWYASVFELKVKNRINDTERGVRVVILESTSFLLELLENKSWLDQKKILENKPHGTRIHGFFKIGFKVPNMDACLKHLAELKIIPERIYTDSQTKNRNFLVNDPDGNLVQFFE